MPFISVFNSIIRARTGFMVIFFTNVARFFATLVIMGWIFDKTIRTFRNSFSFSSFSSGTHFKKLRKKKEIIVVKVRTKEEF